jgi:hypothetical protein
MIKRAAKMRAKPRQAGKTILSDLTAKDQKKRAQKKEDQKKNPACFFEMINHRMPPG